MCMATEPQRAAAVAAGRHEDKGQTVHWYPRYLSIGARRARALPEMLRLRERGVHVQPIETTGQIIAQRFWGRRWCDRLDSFTAHDNHLPLGRSLVRNGSVCHLEIRPGALEAMVAGSALFRVVVRIPTTEPAAWQALARTCAGRVGSLQDLLRGALPDGVIEAVAGPERGLLPSRSELDPHCGCGDGAALCRHAAAALYGVGRRLDAAPELLFRLRGVDETDLLAAATASPASATRARTVAQRLPAEPAATEPAAAQPAPGHPVTAMPAAAEPAPGHPAAARPAAAKPAPVHEAAARPAASRPAPPESAALREPGPAVEREASGFHPTGDLIRRLRRTSGFSVTEFAELLQVSTATVRRWEGASGSLTLRSGPRDALQTLLDAIEGAGAT